MEFHCVVFLLNTVSIFMAMDPLIRKLRRHLLAWLHRSRSGQVYFVRRLSYKDVKRATDGFHRIIYSNSQVAAYTAKFQDGGVSLVKEVKAFDQGNDIFYSEVQFLGRLHHRHLLALKGFSVRHKSRLLIFDNIENGSLKEHLNDPLKTPLNWRTRLQIAIGVVAALVISIIVSLYSILSKHVRKCQVFSLAIAYMTPSNYFTTF